MSNPSEIATAFFSISSFAAHTSYRCNVPLETVIPKCERMVKQCVEDAVNLSITSDKTICRGKKHSLLIKSSTQAIMYNLRKNFDLCCWSLLYSCSKKWTDQLKVCSESGDNDAKYSWRSYLPSVNWKIKFHTSGGMAFASSSKQTASILLGSILPLLTESAAWSTKQVFK